MDKKELIEEIDKQDKKVLDKWAKEANEFGSLYNLLMGVKNYLVKPEPKRIAKDYCPTCEERARIDLDKIARKFIQDIVEVDPLIFKSDMEGKDYVRKLLIKTLFKAQGRDK